MTEEQRTTLEQMDNQIRNVGFTPVQALTLVLSYFKGGYYQGMTEKELEVVIKLFVEKYM